MKIPLNAVWFSHGKESGPWGVKIRHMAQIAQSKGFHVESVDYRGMDDPDQRVEKLLSLQPAARAHLVLAGSSMGGYVACAASQRIRPQGLFLMAPAVGVPGYDKPDLQPAANRKTAVHGWRDDVIPVAKAFELCRRCDIELHVLNCGHALLENLPGVLSLFGRFLDEVISEGVSAVDR